MKVEVLPYSVPDLKGPPRSEGLHLSNIIRDVAITMGFFKDSGKINPMKSALGFAWELYLDKTWCRKHGVFRPEEVVCDGIAGSPDGLGVDDGYFGMDGCYFLAEYKNTWYSTNKDLNDTWYWQAQTKSYLWMLSAEHDAIIDTVLMPVSFVNGDYQHPYEPQFGLIKYTYSPLEIRENWIMVTNHALSQGWLKKGDIKSLGRKR